METEYRTFSTVSSLALGEGVARNTNEGRGIGPRETYLLQLNCLKGNENLLSTVK